jgi:hypothetical protein
MHSTDNKVRRTLDLPPVGDTQTEALTIQRQREVTLPAVVNTQAIESHAHKLASKAVELYKKIPLAGQLLAADFFVHYVTHPHMLFQKGMLLAIGGAMLLDAWKRREAAKKEGK